MRARVAGTIVNITSMGGKIYRPLGGWYHVTKSALDALGDCLRLEVRPFGIDVIVIEPGGIATERGSSAEDFVEHTSGHGPCARHALSFGAKPLVLARRLLGDPLFDALITRPRARPDADAGLRKAATLPPAGRQRQRAGCFPDPSPPA